MAYTVEAFSDTPTTAPAVAPPIIKEERVVTPYVQDSKRLEAAMAKVAMGQSGQPGKVEGTEAKEPASAPQEPGVKLSPGAAALARKEQKFRQEQAKLKAEKESLAAERAEVARLKEMQQKLAAKDYSGLDGIVNYDEYTQHQLNRMQTQTEEQKAIQAMSEKIAQMEKANEENINRQFEAAVYDRKREADRILTSDEKLSQFSSTVKSVMPKVNLPDVVTQHILDTWEHDNQELSVEQAAQEVVDVMINKAKTWSKLLGTSQQAPDQKKPLPPMSKGLSTLTNRVTIGESAQDKKPDYYRLPESQRWELARQRALQKLQTQGR